jgi:hypothetical protein
MAQHDVDFIVPQRPLGKVDIEFIITKDGAQLGKIKISKGGIDYYPKNAKKPISKTWTQLDTLFQGK